MEFVKPKVKNKKLILIFIFILALVEKANASISNDKINTYIKEATNKELYNNIQWKNLLHNYNNKNTINDDNFWLSNTKKPKDELIYTIKEIFNNKENGNHVLCRFPARTKFILDNLNIDNRDIPTVKCQELDVYLSKVIYDKIYISYASENILSPMSMMGHMFIKIVGFSKEENKTSNHALSYYANYNKDQENILSFYIKSVFSGSNGLYNILPYRKKLIEYNDIGKRNIYDYELNLNDEERKYIILHIWELKNINVPYNFIVSNCGVATIRVLAVGNNNFIYSIKKKWATPLDILKILYSENLINSIEIFPSEQYKIQTYKDNFSKKENKMIEDFVLNNNINIILEQDRKNELLFMSDIVSGNLLLTNKISEKQYNEVQKNIYDNFDGVNDIKLKQKTKIQLNSPFSSSLKVDFGKYKNNSGADIAFYPVYRSLYDNNSEYFSDFTLNLLNFDLFFNEENQKLIVKEIDLLKVKSIIPTSYFLKSLSFNFDVGYKDSTSKYNNSGNFFSEIGVGKSYSFNDIITSYAIINGGFFEKIYLKPEIGIIFKYKNSKTVLSYNYFVNYKSNLNSLIDLNYSLYFNDRLALVSNYQLMNFNKNIKSYSNFNIGLKYYF